MRRTATGVPQLLLGLSLGLALQPRAYALDNGLSLLPPMGWGPVLENLTNKQTKTQSQELAPLYLWICNRIIICNIAAVSDIVAS